MRRLTASQLKMMRDRREDFVLINTLSEEHFAAAHIPESINVPLHSRDFVQRVEKAARNKDRKIVVYCASAECDSSTKAVQQLEAAGFTNVYDFESGVEGWQEAGETMAVG